MRLYTKEELIEVFKVIKSKGWIESGRQGNAGGVGNTIEDLYGIKENNLPIANSAEWELKSQRITNRGGNASSLTTLFHFEPSPRAVKFVPAFFLPYYGWRHEEAGIKYPASEMSFRQTISGRTRTNRGFGIAIDEDKRKVMITFDASAVSEEHHEWLKSVEKRIGLGELKPQPYWGFDDLFHNGVNNASFALVNLPDLLAHIDSQAAQIEALKEKLIQERGKYIAVYEEDEWDFDDLPELDAREYIRTAHQQLKAEMPEVEWEC